MQSVPYILMSSIPMFICIFWAVVFLGRYSSSHLSKRILFWFMATASVLYFAHFVVFNHLYKLIPISDTIYTFATASVYPIFYLYLVALTGKLRRLHLSILLPGALLALWIGATYTFTPQALLRPLIEACHYESGTYPPHDLCALSLYAHQALKYLIVLQILTILPAGFRRLRLFRAEVVRRYSNIENRDLRGIRLLLYAFIITSFCSLAADLIGRAYFVDSLELMLLVLLPFSSLLFLIGYIGNNQQFTIDDLMQEVEDPVPATLPAGSAHPSRQQVMHAEIDRLMAEEQLYLNPDLKISDIAAHLNTNRTYIYEALRGESPSEAFSFPDHINRFRIEHSCRLIVRRLDIESVIYNSGFTTRSTFYKNFKKFTGLTPAQYLKKGAK